MADDELLGVGVVLLGIDAAGGAARDVRDGDVPDVEPRAAEVRHLPVDLRDDLLSFGLMNGLPFWDVRPAAPDG